MSSPNMQNMQLHQEMGGSVRLDTLLPHPVSQFARTVSAASTVIASRVMPGLSAAGIGEDASENVEVGGVARPSRSKAWICLTVPVKFVWISKRSMSQTTSSGGFSRASRYK